MSLHSLLDPARCLFVCCIAHDAPFGPDAHDALALLSVDPHTPADVLACCASVLAMTASDFPGGLRQGAGEQAAKALASKVQDELS